MMVFWTYLWMIAAVFLGVQLMSGDLTFHNGGADSQTMQADSFAEEQNAYAKEEPNAYAEEEQSAYAEEERNVADNVVYLDCKICRGKGRCSVCKGEGGLRVSANDIKRPCMSCHCSGRCPTCRGTGKLTYVNGKLVR